MKFHLFGTSLSGDAVDQYAVTDKDGVATFKDVLISGSEPYILEEVDTAIRYVVPKNQIAPVKWKEVTTRNFNNILKKFTVTVTKSDAEKGEAQGNAKLSGAVYGIYKGETLVDKYVTDENGQFTTKEYVCDTDWTIREITPSEGYLLDKTIHEVGADPKLYEVEHNLTSNDVTEQVIKGNVAIIKHTDDGETKIETPEKGASFEIYLKSAGSYDAANKDERDTIVCDENGFGQTKDMPYGIYTVHQTSGWEGREMMDDFDVFISQNAQTYRYLINNRNFESFVNVVKVDAESGKSIPYAGAGFKIYDPQGNQVKMTFTYPTPTTIDVFYTDANGSLVTPEKLDYGKGYSIVEVQAPYGYVLDDTPVYFDITEENSTEEGGVTVVKVNKPNMAQKGTITVEKTGEVFSGVNVSGSEDSDVIYQPVYEVAGLEGAVYEVRAAEDISTPDGTLRYSTEGSSFEEVEEDIVAFIYKNVVTNSVAYMMMSRLGVDTDGYFELDDFRDVTNFNTQETLNALGFATIKPLPSMDGQMTFILDGRAEEKKTSAFTFSQEIIDAILANGSGFSEGKMRIYEQFEKSLSAKENADFLKNEYGWGGSYPVIIGAGIDESHDGKGITITKGIGKENPHITLSWSQVEKRIGELIRTDRYLNPKEKEHYPQWLESQEERRAKIEETKRNREILSNAPPEQEVELAEKEPEEWN